MESESLLGGEKESVSSFDTETPPSLSPATKRKKCTQFSLNKSPSAATVGRKKNKKKVVVSRQIKKEIKPKAEKTR